VRPLRWRMPRSVKRRLSRLRAVKLVRADSSCRPASPTPARTEKKKDVKTKQENENKRKEKKRQQKKKITPLGVNLMRSQVLYRAAQVPLLCNAAGIMLLLASWNGMAHLVFYAQQAALFKGDDMTTMRTASHVALHGMVQTLHDWCCLHPE